MIQSLANWLDLRIGYRNMLNRVLLENIPGGAKFRYVTGSMLVFAFTVQMITGIILWAAYSPSSQTAYESVYYIQHEMPGGWLLRGIHHFMAQAMMIVMGLHLLQVIIDSAYRAPREVNYWLGLVLMQIVIGLGLTGYLLPWDQKGYWATNVATNLATLVPVFGKQIQQVAVGGSEYGHHTLTRFFALHTGLLPASLIAMLIMHIAVFRRHGITTHPQPGKPDELFWPKQVLYDGIACLLLLGGVVGFAIHWDILGFVTGSLPEAHRGAELGAPADPAEAYSAARPEWYFLFLFQLLKYFPGTSEIWGAIILPGIVMTILALAPIIGRSQMGHKFNVAFVLLVLVGAMGLTAAALREDYYYSLAQRFGWTIDEKNKAQMKLYDSSREFLLAKEDAEHQAARIHSLIQAKVALPEQGKLSPKQLIPKQGAVYLLRNDPGTRGERLFKQHCASCHDFTGDENGRTAKVEAQVQGSPELAMNGAPNLYGFASKAWVRGLLNKDAITKWTAHKLPEKLDKDGKPEPPQWHIESPFFGNTAHREGRMVEWVKSHEEFLKDEANVNAIAAALSAQARLKRQAVTESEEKEKELIVRGVGLIKQNCTNGCHRFGDDGQLGLAPDLTGYGSYEWMLGLISDPNHERFYRNENDRMPAFAADLEKPATHTVSPRELSLIVDWIRDEFYRPDDLTGTSGPKDDAHYKSNPNDHFPILSHSEEQARVAVRAARTLAEPLPSVVGSAPVEASKLAQAEALFAKNCSGCHSRTNEHGVGIAAKSPSAPNLFGFASRKWLEGLLDPKQIAEKHYFGGTRHAKGEMVGFVNDNLTDLDDEKKQALAEAIVALSAEAALPAQKDADAAADGDGSLARGRKSLAEFEWAGGSKCVDCHRYRDAEADDAPVLTGYGSKEWLTKFLTDPGHADFYGAENDRMPAFGGKKGKRAILKPAEIEVLVELLRGEL